MVESQSRYGIMESLNSKKIEAQKRLSALEKELEQQQMAFDNTVHQIEKQISNAEGSYESEHLNWVKNETFRLNEKKMQFEVDQTLAKAAHEREVEETERQIQEKKDTYKENHITFIEGKGTELVQNNKGYENWKKLKDLEKVAIEKEIAGFDTALADLKEVSKESVKKD